MPAVLRLTHPALVFLWTHPRGSQSQGKHAEWELGEAGANITHGFQNRPGDPKDPRDTKGPMFKVRSAGKGLLGSTATCFFLFFLFLNHQIISFP